MFHGVVTCRNFCRKFDKGSGKKTSDLYKKKKKTLKRVLCDGNQKKKLWEKVCETVVSDYNELSAEDKTKQGTYRYKFMTMLATIFRQLFYLL